MENDRYNDIPGQKLLLLMKRTERINGKRYLRLVALDYIRGNILTIYDDDGEPDLKLHSWDKNAEALHEMTVIKAKLLYDNLQEYAAKALAPIETVSRGGNLKLFLKKIYVQSLLSAIEGKSNLPFPVVGPDILETADNISIDQSFYNTGRQSSEGEEELMFDMYWHYDEDENAAQDDYSISEDDNLKFEWYFEAKKPLSFREWEYQLIDISGSRHEEKRLALLNRELLNADEKTNRDAKQGKFFNGLALVRRSGESFVADRLWGEFQRSEKPLYIDELTKEFSQLEEKILMVASENSKVDFLYPNEDEIQYGEIEGSEAVSGRHNAILTGIAGNYPDYAVTDAGADDFATEYGPYSGAGKRKSSQNKNLAERRYFS